MEVNLAFLHNAFFERLKDYPLSVAAQALFHCVMNLQNRAGRGNRWSPSVSPTVRQLAYTLDLSENKLYAARKELVDSGYITYEPAGGSGTGEYSIVLLYEDTFRFKLYEQEKVQAAQAAQADPTPAPAPATCPAAPTEGTLEAPPKPQKVDKCVDKSNHKTAAYKNNYSSETNLNERETRRGIFSPPTPTNADCVCFSLLPKEQQEALVRLKNDYRAKSINLKASDFPANWDYCKVLEAVKASDFLQKCHQLGINWLKLPYKHEKSITNYQAVIDGFYVTYSKPAPPPSAHVSAHPTRQYTKEEWAAMSDDIDKVEM